jgi:hypothetical protein
MSLNQQRGAFNLYAVVILSALLAAAAMAALFSMRSERNLFAEGAAKAGKMAADSSAGGAIEAARSALAAASASSSQMRKCIIDGKMVVSNTDCTDQNKTTKVIKIQDSRGFEAPKKPVKPAAEPTAEKLRDQMIDKQTQ